MGASFFKGTNKNTSPAVSLDVPAAGDMLPPLPPSPSSPLAGSSSLGPSPSSPATGPPPCLRIAPGAGTGVSITLVPHEHSLFCERKERVCTSVGKLQEHERLRVTSSVIDLHDHDTSFVWMRSSAAPVRRGAEAAGGEESDESVCAEEFEDMASFEMIDGTEGRDEYELVAQDVNCFIAVRVFQRIHNPAAKSADDKKGEGADEDAAAVDEHDFDIKDIACEIAMGPVLAGPPRLLDLSIAGEMTVGSSAVAQIKYIGGTPGPSEFWWMRIRDGDREQITDPRPIDAADAASPPRSQDDPRIYVIGAHDVACILKVKCRPVRIDGHRGEIFTSKPSAPCVLPTDPPAHKETPLTHCIQDDATMEAIGEFDADANCPATVDNPKVKQGEEVEGGETAEEGVESLGRSAAE